MWNLPDVSIALKKSWHSFRRFSVIWRVSSNINTALSNNDLNSQLTFKQSRNDDSYANEFNKNERIYVKQSAYKIFSFC